MKRNGLTLVELLVSITIVGVLVSVGILVVRQALGVASKTQSSSNLRQLGFGIMMFVQEHNGRLPPSEEGVNAGTFPGPTLGTVVPHWGPTWAEYVVKKYLGENYDILRCPDRPDHWASGRGKYPDYGFNQRLSPVSGTYRQGMLIETINNPSQIILLADSVAPGNGEDRFGVYRIYTTTDMHPRHINSTVNVLYLDQRLESHVLDYNNLPAANEPLGRNELVPQ